MVTSSVHNNLGARARAGGPASRAAGSRAAAPQRRARATAARRHEYDCTVECTGRKLYSAKYCMERMRCATRLATRYARYSLEPDARRRAARTPARSLACRHARARAKRGQRAVAIGRAYRGVAVAKWRQSRARQPLARAPVRSTAKHGGSHTHARTRLYRSEELGGPARGKSLEK